MKSAFPDKWRVMVKNEGRIRIQPLRIREDHPISPGSHFFHFFVEQCNDFSNEERDGSELKDA